MEKVEKYNKSERLDNKFEIELDELGIVESMMISKEQISKLKEKEFIELVSVKLIEAVKKNELGGLDNNFRINRTIYFNIKRYFENNQGEDFYKYALTNTINRNINWNRIAIKNTEEKIPKEYRDNDNLIVVEPDFFKMKKNDFQSNFRSGRKFYLNMKRFFRKNGYFWFINEKDGASAMVLDGIRRNSERTIKKTFSSLVEERSDSIERVLESGEEIDIRSYLVRGVTRDDLVEIKLADYLREDAVDLFDKLDVDTIYRKNILDKMISDGKTNAFIPNSWLRSQGRGGIVNSLGIENIDLLKGKENKTIFPEWYTDEVFESDFNRAKGLFFKALISQSKKNNSSSHEKLLSWVREEIRENYEDLLSESKVYLLSLAGSEEFKEDFFRIDKIKKVIHSHVRKTKNEYSIDQVSDKGEEYSLLDNLSTKEYHEDNGSSQISSLSVKNFSEKDLEKKTVLKIRGILSRKKDRALNEAIVDEIKSKINLRNYNNNEEQEEDLKFFDEFIRYRYSVNDDTGELRDRDIREIQEDMDRFIKIINRNHIDISNYI